LRQAPVKLLLKREPNLERDLPVTDFAVLDVSAGLGYLKPAHVADGLFSSRQRVFYCLFKSVGRGTNHLNLFVNMLRHAGIILSGDDQTQQKAEPSRTIVQVVAAALRRRAALRLDTARRPQVCGELEARADNLLYKRIVISAASPRG
jgi:hypothetical protein